MFSKYYFEDMLKKFAQSRRDSDSPVVGRIPTVTLAIFDYGYHVTISELSGYVGMAKHSIEKMGNSL